MAIFSLSISIFAFYYSAVNQSIASLVTAVVFLTMPILVVLNVIRKRVVVEADSITYTGIFSQKRLPFLSIRGYRIGFKNIYLEPLQPGDPTIVIWHYRDLENGRDLMLWVTEAFQDLNTADRASQRATILTNVRLGATEEVRMKKLVRAHSFAQIYNVGSLPLILILFLNTGKTVILLLVYPLIGILLMIAGRGLIKFQSDRQRSICSFVFFGIFVPGFALLIKTGVYYEVLDTAHLWAPALGISLLLFVLIYMPGINRSMGMMRAQVTMMILTALMYGFGGALQVNCVFDPTHPVVYNTIILGSHEEASDDRTTGHKKKSYSMTIGPWGPRHEPEVVSVPESLYRQSQIGDTVQVHLRAGLLHIPWFFITNDKTKITQ